MLPALGSLWTMLSKIIVIPGCFDLFSLVLHIFSLILHNIFTYFSDYLILFFFSIAYLSFVICDHPPQSSCLRKVAWFIIHIGSLLIHFKYHISQLIKRSFVFLKNAQQNHPVSYRQKVKFSDFRISLSKMMHFILFIFN